MVGTSNLGSWNGHWLYPIFRQSHFSQWELAQSWAISRDWFERLGCTLNHPKTIQSGAPENEIAKLVDNSNFTLVYGCLWHKRTSYCGLKTQQTSLGGPTNCRFQFCSRTLEVGATPISRPQRVDLHHRTPSIFCLQIRHIIFWTQFYPLVNIQKTMENHHF